MKEKSVFINYVMNNRKNLYFIVGLFFVGMICGIIFINQADNSQTTQLTSYINSLKDNIKATDSINSTVVLKQSIKQNVSIVIIIGLLGCTLFGSFLIYGVVLYKGFSIGYTISAIIMALGVKSRNNFFSSSFIFAKYNFSSSNFYVI